MLSARTAPLAVAFAAVLSISTAAHAAGRWTYHEDRNDGHILSYLDDGKKVFELYCGRGFGLLIKHPSSTKNDGKARLTLVAGKNRIELNGEFVPSYENSVTNFQQAYLGYGKNDPRVYGKRWQEAESRLLDLIESQSGFLIESGSASYKLPPIDIDKWRRPFELCGYGFWVSPREFPAETK